MTVLLAAAVGILFGAGCYLMLKPDLIRVVVGVVLVSHAANLALMSAGLGRGRAPVGPLAEGEPVSDPLVQALTLTAIVIGFAVSALVLALVYRVWVTHDSVDLDDLARAQSQEDEAGTFVPEAPRRDRVR